MRVFSLMRSGRFSSAVMCLLGLCAELGRIECGLGLAVAVSAKGAPSCAEGGYPVPSRTLVGCPPETLPDTLWYPHTQ
jgi:hypothetical protein